MSTFDKNPSGASSEVKFLSQRVFFLQADKIGTT